MLNQLVFENLKHRPVRTFLSVCAVASGVTMILTLVGLSEGMISESKRRTRAVGADVLIRPGNTSAMQFTAATLPEKLVDFFARQPHVALATGAVTHPTGALFESASGVDMEAFSRMNGGLRYLSGGPFREENDVVVDERFADTRNLKVGQTITLWNRPWRVCGIVEAGKLSRVILPKAVVQDLASAKGMLSQIYLKLDDPKNTAAVVAALKANEQLSSYQIYSIEEFVSLFSIDQAPGLLPFIYVVIGVGVLFGFLGVLMSMYTAVLERTREIGILKSLGAAPAFILGILMREAAILALIGSALGILLTFGTQWAINTFGGPALVQQTVPKWWPISTAIAVGGALLGTLYPSLKAVQQDVLEALSYD